MRIKSKIFDLFRYFKLPVSTIIFLFPCHSYLSEISAQDKPLPDIRAGVSGTINCVNTSVTLIGNSDTPQARFTWTGPGGYRATSRNAVTTLPGEYTLKVIGAAGIATAVVKVVVDTLPPTEVKASVSGMLTCIDTMVTLTGNSSTPGVTYSWKGVKGYSSAQQKSQVMAPGIYLLKVTNPGNGCSSLANTEVKQNILPPAGVTATVSDVLTCKTGSITLSGTSATQDVTYNWSGPGFTSSLPKPEVKSPGKYTVTVTDPVNGCSSVASVTAVQNIREPAGLKVTAPDTLTCKTTRVKLTASSASESTGYHWTGPEGFTSSGQTALAITPGNYTVAVTDPVTGCSAKKVLTVIRDITKPDIDIALPRVLTCTVISVPLTVKSSVSKVTYNWSGPGNFSSTSGKPVVSEPGTYDVTITSISTGCSASKSVTVKENTAVPDRVTATASDTLSCATPRVKLSGTSSTNGVSYHWTGPQGFKSALKAPEITLPGNYTLTVTNPENGCSSKATLLVTGKKCPEKQKP